jgi:hypothetical protein
VHREQAWALYDPRQHRTPSLPYGEAPGAVCLSPRAWVWWCLGYPGQALERRHEAVRLAGELSHPFSQARALFWAAHERVEALWKAIVGTPWMWLAARRPSRRSCGRR